MTDTAQSHPAIAVILMVEGTPAFLHAARALDAECAVATQLAPETLPPAWTRRLALRYAVRVDVQGKIGLQDTRRNQGIAE
jgi:hypothetical protein